LFGVRYHEKSTRRRHAKSHEALLTERMIRVIAGGGEDVYEHARSLFERYTMFPQISSCLARIPFETHPEIPTLSV
jgi:hypothetical protein